MNVKQKLKPGSLCKIKDRGGDITKHYYSQLYGNKIVVLLKFFKGTGKYGYGTTDQINAHRANDTWLFYSIEKGTFAQLIPDCFEIFEAKEINENTKMVSTTNDATKPKL